MLSVVFVGATGTGKSALSLDAACEFNGHIINADSMQLYRDMDIGTAKLPISSRRGVPHHQIDVISPAEDASVARYKSSAKSCINEVKSLNCVPILAGGSGLYVSSIVQDLQFPPTCSRVRQSLEAEADERGVDALYETLQRESLRMEMLHSTQSVRANPAITIARGNRRRIIRALEVLRLTGYLPNFSLPTSLISRKFLVINLVCETGILLGRLKRRVDAFYDNGLLDEMKMLQAKYTLSSTASRAIGYRQAILCLAGEMTCVEAKESTFQETVKLAKRQIKWFRRYSPQCIVDATDISLAAKHVRHILKKCLIASGG